MRSRSVPIDEIPDAPIHPQVNQPVSAVSSILPRQIWALVLLIGCGFCAWGAVVGGGAWLDHQQIDPWQDILGLRSGRLLRFFNTITLLTCAQLSYLILWRRSRSRKDFAGKYRVWFWVGAVCSVFCVATATRVHESWAALLTGKIRSHAAWWSMILWLVPGASMLMSAMHLIRRDMPYRSASIAWVQASRLFAVIAGINLLFGPIVWPVAWSVPIEAALCSLWPTLFASSLLIHVRFVTYVTNEAAMERRQPSRTARWEARARLFTRHVMRLAREEWQLYLKTRAEAKAGKESLKTAPIAKSKVEVQPSSSKRTRKGTTSSTVSQVTAPLRDLNDRFGKLPRPQEATSQDEQDELDASGPGEIQDAEPVIRPELKRSTVAVHSAQPIPAPHINIETTDSLEGPSLAADQAVTSSGSIPQGYSSEQWSRMSKKDRKKAQRSRV